MLMHLLICVGTWPTIFKRTLRNEMKMIRYWTDIAFGNSTGEGGYRRRLNRRGTEASGRALDYFQSLVTETEVHSRKKTPYALKPTSRAL